VEFLSSSGYVDTKNGVMKRNITRKRVQVLQRVRGYKIPYHVPSSFLLRATSCIIILVSRIQSTNLRCAQFVTTSYMLH
jgi:hypothetical protein